MASQTQTQTQVQRYDVVIVGAGISGIGMGYYLTKQHAGKSWTILERRGAIGGTWDLFRYPGIRSDSDMYTFGYAFRPWTEPKIFSDGKSIREYVSATAREHGIDRKIQHGIKVVRASWSSRDATWTVEAVREATGEALGFVCNFLISCTGYYNYDRGYTPELPGLAQFKGQVIHPQHWPENLDYKGKRVVVIGSGATAVTIVPAMADGTAASVTMLQRSPTYIVALPEIDPMSAKLGKVLPKKLVYRLVRGRNIALQLATYHLAKAKPGFVRDQILRNAKKLLGDTADANIEHFSPRYKPWDERMCIVPDGDLFRAIRNGKAAIVTDEIATFDDRGIQLKSGARLDADIVITATGLNVQLLGGMELSVDGVRFEPGKAYAYKAIMFEGLPNCAMLFGYPNQSWTLKVDIAAQYVCRLLKFMDERKISQATPRNTGPALESAPFLTLKSGYIQRGEHLLPRVATTAPWRLHNNYFLDRWVLRHDPIDDGHLSFVKRRPTEIAATPARAVAT